ncbi:Hydroxymethylglutaryl-CoA lyase YngG [compost metagenome]
MNYVAALDAGVRWFDCAVGGVGGHPAKVKYGGGHTGNVATEDLVSLFESMGVRTGLDLDGLAAVSQRCREVLGRDLHSRVADSGFHPLIKAGA